MYTHQPFLLQNFLSVKISLETWVVCVLPPNPFCLKLRSLVICDFSDLHRRIQSTQNLQCYAMLGELMMLLIKALVKE